jgi:hypothetical protein
MKFRQVLVLLLVSIFYSGCASTLTSADKSRIRRVGVISLVGDSVRGSYVGLTVFGNENYDALMPDLALDQIIETETARSIGSGSVALPMEREAVRSAAGYTRFFAGTAPYDVSRAAGVIRAIAAQRKLDALAIWTPTVFEDYGLRLRGASLSSGTFQKNVMNAGLLAVMDVYDGPTGKRLAGNIGTGSPGTFSVPWRDKFEQFTPDERAAIRAEFQRQASAKAASAPRNLGLAR